MRGGDGQWHDQGHQRLCKEANPRENRASLLHIHHWGWCAVAKSTLLGDEALRKRLSSNGAIVTNGLVGKIICIVFISDIVGGDVTAQVIIVIVNHLAAISNVIVIGAVVVSKRVALRRRVGVRGRVA